MDYSHVRRTAPRHIHWKKIRIYEGIYRQGKRGKGRARIKVRSLTPLPPTRTFRLVGAQEKHFKLVKYQTTIKEFIEVMPTKTKTKPDSKSDKAKTKSRKKTAEEETDEELDGIEDVADLDEVTLDDEDTEETETDDTDDDEDEESDDDDDDDEEVEKPKGKKKKQKTKGSRASNNGKIGTQEIAAEAGCDARTLRMVLRKHSVEKDEETGRYEWESLKDPTVKKILKWIADGEAKDIKKESLDKLKEKKAEEKKGKKGKKDKKKKKKEEEDEDDE